MAITRKIDEVPELSGSRYPPPHDGLCAARRWRPLALAVGLTRFGVNRAVLPPGAWASQRHAHSADDEFFLILEGRLTLIDDDGERELTAGDIVGCPAGDGNAHHFVNRSDADAVYLAVGSRDDADRVVYPDIGMRVGPGRYRLQLAPFSFDADDG